MKKKIPLKKKKILMEKKICKIQIFLFDWMLIKNYSGILGTKIKFSDIKIGMQLIVSKKENIKRGNSNWVSDMDRVTFYFYLFTILFEIDTWNSWNCKSIR